MHVHLRDGPAMREYVYATAQRFSRALVMPNLIPPVTTVEQALEYRTNILLALQSKSTELKTPTPDFIPLMTLYLTDSTTEEDIASVHESKGDVIACKLYPAGATTNSQSGVTSLDRIDHVLKAMERYDVVLCIHGETTETDVDIFDKERVFVRDTLPKLLSQYPSLRIVLEHVTTVEAVEAVRTGPDTLAATITPHHLLSNRNALFRGGLNPHCFCLPVLKTEDDRIALLKAATSGSPKFFAGTDSAPHTKSRKGTLTALTDHVSPQQFTVHCLVISCPIALHVHSLPLRFILPPRFILSFQLSLTECARASAGCYTSYAAVELYAEAFAQVEDGMDNLKDFLCTHAQAFYRLPEIERTTLRLAKMVWKAPAYISVAAPERSKRQQHQGEQQGQEQGRSDEGVPDDDQVVVPFKAGEDLQWKIHF